VVFMTTRPFLLQASGWLKRTHTPFLIYVYAIVKDRLLSS
jgi:hypothetical protein